MKAFIFITNPDMDRMRPYDIDENNDDFIMDKK